MAKGRYSIEAEFDEREYKLLLEIRQDRPWRTVILEALGIPETPRKLGRPKRTSTSSTSKYTSTTSPPIVPTVPPLVT